MLSEINSKIDLLVNKYFITFKPKSDLIDFTLSNARQFYSSKGDLLGVKLLRCLIYGLYKPYNTTVIKLAKSKQQESSGNNTIGSAELK